MITRTDIQREWCIPDRDGSLLNALFSSTKLVFIGIIKWILNKELKLSNK